ncbi:hypothetical protein CBS101457_005420 [Exobasidium rhododendri]|nr:hypothetical protein CBS101457_005420 [Exobasidium rhododendri]
MEFMSTPPKAHERSMDDHVNLPADVIKGWHPGQSAFSKPAISSAISSNNYQHKGKAREPVEILQRTPRQTAASNAATQAARSSAPPSSPRLSDAKDHQTAAASPSASSSSAVGSGSNHSALWESPLHLNGNRVRQGRAVSSSPFAPLTSTTSSPPSSSRSVATASPIDAAEQKQFNFQAIPSEMTAILPRPPPSLPYDISYLPLSPMGVDQTGHVLIPPPSGVALGIDGNPGLGSGGKGAPDTVKVGRGHQSGPTKKHLPGQELESHIVSEITSQEAMPWGLKATLLEKQRGGKRGRTKMGTLRRTTMQAGRRKKGRSSAVETVPIKMEDDSQSEVDSLHLPPTGHSVMEGEKDDARPDQQTEVSELDGGVDATTETSRGMSMESSQDVEMEHPTPAPQDKVSESPISLLKSSMTPKKLGRPLETGLVSPVQTISTPAEALTSHESAASSVDASPGNVRRPREAHKRLKMMGGYYRKAGQKREESAVVAEALDRDASEAIASSSRTTSSVPEDGQEVVTLQEQDRATTPIESVDNAYLNMPKADRQQVVGSMSGSLRRMTTAPSVNGSPNKLTHVNREAAHGDSNDGGNNEYCETCGGVGHFICCDGCPRSFHFACIDPPLDIDELPSTIGDESDTWYCNVCRAEKKKATALGKGKKAGNKNGGVFGPLISHIEEVNPTIFALPLEVRSYFKGVATASDGSYVNSAMLRPIKVNKFGILDEREPLRLKDKNGKMILCFRCGGSAMPLVEPVIASSSPSKAKDRPVRAAAIVANAAVTTPLSSSSSSSLEEEEGKKGWRKIVSCDFCSLHWHLDCLDPPLASMPSLSRKWMCPNHIEHVLPSERIPKSTANSTSIHELPLPSRETVGPGKHYRTRVVNDGQIDIIPDPMDTYVEPSIIEGGDYSRPGKSSRKNDGNIDKGWEEQEVIVPGYKNYPSVFGSQNTYKIKYRVPEKVVRLDFWTKAELEREKLAEAAIRERQALEGREEEGEEGEERIGRGGIELLALIANALSIEEASSNISTAAKKDEKSMPVRQAKEMVEAVFVDHPFVPSGEEAVSLLRQTYIPGEYEREFEGIDEPKQSLAKSSREANVDSQSVSLDADQVQAIRQLIAYKGKDALLRFLLE